MAKTTKKPEAIAPAKKPIKKATPEIAPDLNIGDAVKYQLLDDEADALRKERGAVIFCTIKEPKPNGFFMLQGEIRSGQHWHRSAQYASKLTPGYFTK